MNEHGQGFPFEIVLDDSSHDSLEFASYSPRSDEEQLPGQNFGTAS